MTEAKKYMKIPMTETLNDRKLCKVMAEEIASDKKITGMSVEQLECEIFAHAYVFCFFKYLPDFVKSTSFAKRVYTSVSDGVDLEDDGDSLVRRVFYRVIWFMPSIA